MKLEFQKMSMATSILLSIVGLAVSYSCYGFGIYRVWSGAISYGTMTMFLSAVGLSHGNLKPAGVSGANGSVFNHIGGKTDGHSRYAKGRFFGCRSGGAVRRTESVGWHRNRLFRGKLCLPQWKAGVLRCRLFGVSQGDWSLSWDLPGRGRRQCSA